MQAGEWLSGMAGTIREEMSRTVPAGYSVHVSVKDGLAMEVRLMPVDVLAEAFPVSQGGTQESVTVPGPVEVPLEQKRAQEAPRKAGFEGVGLIPTCAGVDQERLRGAIEAFPWLFTQTRQGSGVWQQTCLQLSRLSSGLFMAMDQNWDQAWMKKVQNRWGIPGVIREGMGCTEAAISAVIECCNYIGKMRESAGGYWWPPLRNGRLQKVSLLDFLHTLKRNCCAYSPFIEVYGEMMAARGMAAAIPGNVRVIAGDIKAASTLLSSLGIGGRQAYWEGVLKFCQWYRANRDVLMGVPQNRCRVHTLAAMAGLAKAWAEASGNRCMPVRFIHPDSAAWASFIRWLKVERGVTIPREAW